MTDYHQRAIICNHIFGDSHPVLLVVHAADGEWMFLCGGEHSDDADQYQVAGIGHLVDRDPSLAELLDLPAGHAAERTAPGGYWDKTVWVE